MRGCAGRGQGLQKWESASAAIATAITRAEGEVGCQKQVWKGPPGLSTSQDASKLRSESNGMPPGAQNPEKKIKNPQKIRKSPHSYPLYGGSIVFLHAFPLDEPFLFG